LFEHLRDKTLAILDVRNCTGKRDTARWPHGWVGQYRVEVAALPMPIRDAVTQLRRGLRPGPIDHLDVPDDQHPGDSAGRGRERGGLTALWQPTIRSAATARATRSIVPPTQHQTKLFVTPLTSDAIANRSREPRLPPSRDERRQVSQHGLRVHGVRAVTDLFWLEEPERDTPPCLGSRVHDDGFCCFSLALVRDGGERR
jgi:hypothetical protein